MNLSELLPFLASHNLRPKKGLSQNFLIDPNIPRKIVRIAEIAPEDSVLEIGPGTGALTRVLCQSSSHVYAIEKDPALTAAFQSLSNLTLFRADALTFPIDTLPRPLKVVANLPYHITSPILEKLFAHAPHFSTLTLMVQKELALRLMAKPNTPAFSSLTLFTQFYTTLKTHFSVPASCFYPRPRVDSTVLHFTLRPPLLQDPEPFFLLIRRAFQQRRKMLRTSLKALYSAAHIEAVLSHCNLPRTARPEMLSLPEWLSFFSEITSLT